jgi:hypothetical protein
MVGLPPPSFAGRGSRFGTVGIYARVAIPAINTAFFMEREIRAEENTSCIEDPPFTAEKILLAPGTQVKLR